MKFKISNKFISDIKSFLSGNGTNQQRIDGYMKLSITLLCSLVALNTDSEPIQKTISSILTSVVLMEKSQNEPIDTNDVDIVTNEVIEILPSYSNYNSVIESAVPIDNISIVTNKTDVNEIAPNSDFKELSLDQRIILKKIELSKDKKKILDKLGLTEKEFEAIMSR